MQSLRDILDGKLDILNGCARLTKQLYAAGLRDDPDSRVFIGVESETDHLPYGNDRQYWAAEALRRKDKEIGEAMHILSKAVFDACRRRN